MKIHALALLILSSIAIPVAAQITVTDLTEGRDAQDLADAMAGSGISIVPDSAVIIQTVIPGYTFDTDVDVVTGSPLKAAGTFTTGAVSPFGNAFTSGLILGSGHAELIQGVSNGATPPDYNVSTRRSAELGLTGDAQLDAVFANEPSEDATALEFEFVPDSSYITFEFVFASEEYTEWVGDGFNDIFAFFINGENVNHAVVGPNRTPVSVDSINPGSNPQLYVDNEIVQSQRTESDGYTTVLTCYAPVNANVENTMKLVIADRGDSILDSWVLVRAGSFTTTRPLVLTKTPDSAICQAGATNGYTISVTNPGSSNATLNKIVDYLPAGFTYSSGTTTGFTTANPTIVAVGGRPTLTWTGTWTVPANSTITLNFDVTTNSVVGIYTNSVDGDASVPVIPSGETAAIDARPPLDIGVTSFDGQDLVDGSAFPHFGGWIVGSTQFTRTFTIRNDGASSNLTGLSVSVTGTNAADFTVNTAGMATSLAPLGTTTFTVSFKPGGTDLRYATLQIASNDPEENPFDIYIDGRGETTLTGFQSEYVKASNPQQNGSFGIHVAVWGDTVAVSANNSAVGSDNGAVYVFRRDPVTNVLSQEAYLTGSNSEYGDWFGNSGVSIHGDTIVVGSHFEDSNATGVNAPLTGGSGTQADNSATDAGAAYVFTRDPSTGVWSQQAYLKASNTEAGDRFGCSVAVWRDSIAVGAYSEDSNATGVNGNQSNNSTSTAGAVYIFTRSGSTWTQQAYLKQPGPGADSGSFGLTVALNESTLLVGGYTPGMRVYVLVRSGSTWSHQAVLTASNGEPSDYYGCSVALSGDTAVIGAKGEASSAAGVNGNQSDNSAVKAGAAYVYTRSGTTWTQQAYLKASNPQLIDYFGTEVAIWGNIIVVGALGEDSYSTGINNGGQSDNSISASGAAYVFVRNGSTWSQCGYVKASNPGVSDGFGRVAVYEGTVVISAANEDGGAPGVNGDQSDNSVFDAGAAYVFRLFY